MGLNIFLKILKFLLLFNFFIKQQGILKNINIFLLTFLSSYLKEKSEQSPISYSISLLNLNVLLEMS